MRASIFATSIFVVVCAGFASRGWGASLDRTLDPAYVAKRMAELAADQDDMGLRIVAKKALEAGMAREAWAAGRAALMSRPGVGWDVLVAWDGKRPSSSRSEIEVDELVATGDRLTKEKKFAEAFAKYQGAAKLIKATLRERAPANDLLYASVLHGMARSLYGARRFADALEVYRWISPPYPFFRQTLFERSWAAFRAGRADLALGALASQHSSYFSLYPLPEAYLVQAYVYRRLCRRHDLATSARSARAFAAKLARGAYGVEQWARGEIETLAYVELIRQPDGERDDELGLAPTTRAQERMALGRELKRRFQEQKPQLEKAIKAVLALTKHGLAAASTDLAPIGRSVSDQRELKREIESWPVENGEDWLDEQGLHVFAGRSQCVERPSR